MSHGSTAISTGVNPAQTQLSRRRRALTVEMIHKISEAWKIPADLLVRPYRISGRLEAGASRHCDGVEERAGNEAAAAACRPEALALAVADLGEWGIPAGVGEGRVVELVATHRGAAR